MPLPLPPTGPTRSVGIALEHEVIDLIDRLRAMGDGPPTSRSAFVRAAVHLWAHAVTSQDPRLDTLLDVIEDSSSS